MLPLPLQSAPTRIGGSATPIRSPITEKSCRQPETPARSRGSGIISGKSALQFITTIVHSRSNTRIIAMNQTNSGVRPLRSRGAGGTHSR